MTTTKRSPNTSTATATTRFAFFSSRQPEDAQRLQAIFEANPVLQARMLERMKAAQKAAEPYVQPKLESYAEPASSKSRCVGLRMFCVCVCFFCHSHSARLKVIHSRREAHGR